MAGTAPDAWPAGLLLSALLAAAAAVDLHRFIIPDAVTGALVASGLAATAVYAPAQVGDHVIGVMAGYGAFAGLGAAYERVRGRPGLGLGDAKLLAGLGAWLGWAALPTVVLGACVIGVAHALLHARIDGRLSALQRIAFGPALAASGVLVWIFGAIGQVTEPALSL